MLDFERKAFIETMVTMLIQPNISNISSKRCKMYRAVQVFKNGKEKKQRSGYDVFFDYDIVEE